jgi:branched-chain amino acid transport system substrate-binding protein
MLAACGEDDDGTTAQPTSSPTAEIAQGDGELVIGTLLPQTGSLAFLGPPEFAGVDLAVKDINDAGGVLGKPIKKFDSDSGDTSTDIASQSVDRLLSNKVDAIIGAASSGVSFTVIDKITGAGVVHFSPANTSPDFTNYNDKGLYFRTAPSDVLQGRVMADLVISDGNAAVGIIALQDPYGEGLAENVQKGVTDGGGEVVPDPIIYDPKAPNYAAEVGQLKKADPDAIVVIGFDETKKIIPELIKQGIGPKQKKIYFVDGNLSNSYQFPPDTLTGIKGTLPGAETSEDLKGNLKKINPKLAGFEYAPEAYDATILTALGAEAAKNDSGTAIASKLVEISKGGTKCSTFADCKQKLAAGEDIDYDGASGPVEFSDKGDPTEATIGIYQYGKDNKYKNLDYRAGKL